MLRKTTSALLLTLACTACSSPPELREEVSPEALAAPYPDLVPSDGLRAQADAGPATSRVAQARPELEGRASSLQARANRLRGAVISGQEKERLSAKVKIEEEG